MVLVGVITSSCCKYMRNGIKLTMTHNGASRMICRFFFSCFYLLQDEYKCEYTKRGATDLEIGPFRPHSVIISSTIQGLSLCLFRCSAFYAMYRGPLLPNFPPYMKIEAQSVASTILGGSNWVIFL